MKVSAHGVELNLPRGWSGRVFSRGSGVATVHAGDFPLVLHDGEFGDASTAHMPHPAAFLALTEYHPGGGLEAGRGLFAAHRLPLPLDPIAFSPARLAHHRPGQAGAQHFFTASGRPFCLYLVLAGARAQRRQQLAVLDRVLASLHIAARG